MKMKIVLLSFIFALLNITSAHAEKCWMVGCNDEIGYILIPTNQYWSKKMFDETKKYDRLFEKFGLPNVNDNITVFTDNNVGFLKYIICNYENNSLCTQKEIDLQIKKFVEPNIISMGTEIKILGYYMIDNNLYAIVYIINSELKNLHKNIK